MARWGAWVASWGCGRLHLVSREDELGVLSACWRECLAGRGRLALVTGSMATGKTALLHKFCELALEGGAALLGGGGSRSEQGIPYGVANQLLLGGPVPARVVEALMDAGQAGAGDDKDPQRPDEPPLLHNVCAAVLKLSRQQPVLLAVDDLEHVDAASLRLLLYLSRRIGSARVLMVLTEGVRPGPAPSQVRSEITRGPHQVVRLRPLSRRDVAELVAARGAPPAAARRCFELSGGNPLLAGALLQDEHWLGQVRGGNEDAPPGTGFGMAALGCLSRGDAALLETVVGLLLLGKDAEPAMIGRLLDVTADLVRARLAELTAAGLLGPDCVHEPGVRAAILAGLDPARLARLHARAAELLCGSGAPATAVARHLVAADLTPPRWALPVLRAAAEHATASAEPGIATRALELAMRGPVEEPEALAVRAALARVEWQVNPSVAARHLPVLQPALAEGALPVRDAAAVIRQLLWRGEGAVAAKALRALTESAEAPGVAVAELSLAYQWIYGTKEIGYELPGQAEVVGRSAAARDSWLRALASLGEVFVKGYSEGVLRGADHVLQRRLGEVAPEVVAVALMMLCHADQTERAAAVCDELIAEATRRGTTLWLALLGCVRGDIALRRGEYAEAERRVRAALGLLPAGGWGVLIGYPLATRLLAQTGLGDHEAAADTLEQVVPDGMANTVFGLRYLQARGRHHLATGRPLAAVRDLEACEGLARDRGFDIPALNFWAADLASGYLRLEWQQPALRVLNEQLDRPAAVLGSQARARALRALAATTTEPRRQVALLREATALLQAGADRAELVAALGDLSAAHKRIGDAAKSRTTALQAEREAKLRDGCGPPARTRDRNPNANAALNADPNVDGKPRAGPADPPPVTKKPATVALSEAERRVATLAALGHTNQDIGRRLYLTVSTVEQHLTRVYRKLNVRGRADLAAAVAATDEPAPTRRC